jgi:hypothetical protein
LLHTLLYSKPFLRINWHCIYGSSELTREFML